MRALTLWLLMCLLPLRLLAGDAMVLQMQTAVAHGKANTAASVAPNGHGCHGTQTQEAAPGGSGGHSGTDHLLPSDAPHTGCGLCDLCHTPMHGAETLLLQALELPRAAPAAHTHSVCSAEGLPDYRPPII